MADELLAERIENLEHPEEEEFVGDVIAAQPPHQWRATIARTAAETGSDPDTLMQATARSAQRFN